MLGAEYDIGVVPRRYVHSGNAEDLVVQYDAPRSVAAGTLLIPD